MSSKARRWALLGGAVAVVALAAIFAPGGRHGTPTLQDRVREVASGLRCPVCQNLSVADSPSGLAREMRTEIGERLRAGATPDEIRDYFVQRYGEFVLLEPTRKGLNWLPWLVPIAGVLIGLAIWARLVRRRTPRAPEAPTPAERERIEADLDALEEPG